MSKNDYIKGLKDGFPIGVAYFSVALSLGIAASNAGLNMFEGALMSLLNHASAGEYVGIQAIKEGSSLFALCIVILITNSRYLLMSLSLSQKIDPKTSMINRFFMGFGITDEIYALAMNSKDLTPSYYYGTMTLTIPVWATGTFLGILLGNSLPSDIINALSVVLFAMFIAIIIPPCKTNKILMLAVALSFVLSYLFDLVFTVSSSVKVIILTVLIAGGLAIAFPRNEDEYE